MDSKGILRFNRAVAIASLQAAPGRKSPYQPKRCAAVLKSNSSKAMQLCREEELQSPQNQRSSRIRNIRRNGSAAPHNNWSPTVNAPRYCDPMFNLRKRPTGIFNVPVTDVGLSS
jgi:hypothetical protein